MQNKFEISAAISQKQSISAVLNQSSSISADSTQRGPQGIPGVPGAAATIEIGTVSTGAAGTEADVYNSGTSSAAILDFIIPRGEQGIQGEQGPQGNGVVNTEFVSTSGLVDTYHINYTNGEYDSFTVTNGRDGVGAVTDVRVNNQSVLVSGVANLTVDNALNRISSNPVENGVVAQAIEDITLAKNPNLNIIGGNLNIDSGNVSGFSSLDYMQFPFIFNFNNYHWSLEMGFTTGADVTTQQNLLDSYYGIAFAIRSGKFVLAISSNGSSWDIANTDGTYSVQANTSYSVKLSWDGVNYTLSYSLDETNYTTDITIASTLVHNATQEYVGGEADIWSGSYYSFGGTINLNNWKLIVNSLDVWLGMDDVGLGSRANIDLSNLTQAGIDVIKNSIPLATSITPGIVKPDGSTITVLNDGTISVDIDEISTELTGKADIDGSNMISSIKNFDGQHTSADYTFIQGANLTNTQGANTLLGVYDISSVLPADNYSYEVTLVMQFTAPAATSRVNILIGGNNSQALNGFLIASRTGQCVQWCTVSVPVSSARTISVRYTTQGGTATLNYMQLISYRRIGTNE